MTFNRSSACALVVGCCLVFGLPGCSEDEAPMAVAVSAVQGVPLTSSPDEVPQGGFFLGDLDDSSVDPVAAEPPVEDAGTPSDESLPEPLPETGDKPDPDPVDPDDPTEVDPAAPGAGSVTDEAVLPPVVPEKIPEPELVDGVWRTGFEFLGSFDYGFPDFGFEDDEPQERDPVPEAVLSLNGKTVRVEGHMIPNDYDSETLKVHTFILSRYLAGCCFGDVPMLNEMIAVDVVDPKGVDYESYRTIWVTGKLTVGEQESDDGYFTGIYRMTAEQVEAVRK